MTATSSAPRTDLGAGSLRFLLAGLFAGSGLIHIAMVPVHASGPLVDPLIFAVAGLIQIGIAAVLVARAADRTVLYSGIIANTLLIGVWIWSRTAGLPWGEHAGRAEAASTVDAITIALEFAAIAVALFMVFAPQRLRFPEMAAIVGGLACVALATVVIVSPETSQHGSHAHEDVAMATSGGHGHMGATPEAVATEMLALDESRCDFGFNPVAYWDEAASLNIDTYGGGTMDMSTMSASADAAKTLPMGGRGSVKLDKLVSLTAQADGEAAAAMLVSELGTASQEEYDAWKSWLVATGTVGGHSEHVATSGDDTGGHGGHVGPHPWTAITSNADCNRLKAELTLAKAVALKYPTAADALAGGWSRVTGFVPGIAAHYMKFSSVDGTFDIEAPEMLLYDGGGPEARVVGLSYYMIHPGTAEPTQGFTGANDHFHRHIGLCVGAGGVIGDSKTTAEDCKARGGAKQGGESGWMSHAWVVAGCESPWGVFSGANPILDSGLAEQSGKNDGACAGSGTRDRYNLKSGGRSAGYGGSGNQASGKG